MEPLRVALGHLAVVCILLLLSAADLEGQAATSRSYGHQVGIRLDSHAKEAALAVLPLGSIEYHGPSGPPLTDSIIAEGLGERLATELRASLFPVLSYTHAPAHSAAYGGTLSVRPEVVTMLVADVLRAMVDNGFKRILILNGHDGNIGPARTAISQVTGEKPNTQMVLVNWWETLPTPDVERLQLFTSGNGGHGHGGPLELSVAAVFAPESVSAGQGPDLPALEGQADFPYYLEKGDTSGWPGYSGKLSEISADKGEVLVEQALERITALVRKWLADDSRPGSW